MAHEVDMKESKKRKPFKTLAGDLKAVRRRPLTAEQVEKLNKVFEKDIQAESQKPTKKIAIDQDSEVEV